MELRLLRPLGFRLTSACSGRSAPRPAAEPQLRWRGPAISLRRHFFATAADLVPGLERFEGAASVRYVRTGAHDSEAPREFHAGRDLPALGFAPSGASAREPAYLVVNRSTAVEVREGSPDMGSRVFYIDQLRNPDSTVSRPGGLHAADVLVAGEIATLGETEAAVELHKLMVRTVTRGFRRVRSFWLGPVAFARLEAGARLTGDVRSPRLYDLQADVGA